MNPNHRLCEVVSVVQGSHHWRWTNWGGDQDACVKECTYDSGCEFAMYSPVQRVCIKAIELQTGDNPGQIRQYLNDRWAVFRKPASLPMKHLQGSCARYTGKNVCATAGECGWNRGKKGYNQYTQFAGGYCGRVKCAASPVGRMLRGEVVEEMSA